MRILWQDGDGRDHVSRAHIVNVSVVGLQLQVDERIPLRSVVSCNDEFLKIRGNGTVRYCSFAKGKYQIGLEFSGGTGWKEPQTDELQTLGQPDQA
jgi:hypothetical protein